MAEMAPLCEGSVYGPPGPRRASLRTGTWILLSILLGIGTTAKAEPDAGDVGDLAKQTQNPVADLISVPFQNNTDFGWGADDDARNTLNIQPVWPVRVTESWNVITRTIVPVVSQPARVPGENRQSGLGDTTFTAFLSPSEPGAVVWGVGPAVLLPTALHFQNQLILFAFQA